MDSRDGHIAEMQAAVSLFGWKKIAALAFYGNKDDIESYLQQECKSVSGKIKVAQEAQVETKETLVGINFTAYQLANHKNSKLVGWYASKFILWTTANKNLYMELIVKYTGLFALHEYIAAKIELKKIDHKDCIQRVDIFSKIIGSLKDDKPAAALTRLLSHVKIPKGFISAEFFDLVQALKSLSDEQLKNCLGEYHAHLQSIPKADLSLFDTQMCVVLARSSPTEPKKGPALKQ